MSSGPPTTHNVSKTTEDTTLSTSSAAENNAGARVTSSAHPMLTIRTTAKALALTSPPQACFKRLDDTADRLAHLIFLFQLRSPGHDG